MSSIPSVLAKMLEEVKDPKYAGKTDEEIAILLNAKEDEVWWRHRRFCPEDVVRMREYHDKLNIDRPTEKKLWWMRL